MHKKIKEFFKFNKIWGLIRECWFPILFFVVIALVELTQFKHFNKTNLVASYVIASAIMFVSYAIASPIMVVAKAIASPIMVVAKAILQFLNSIKKYCYNLNGTQLFLILSLVDIALIAWKYFEKSDNKDFPTFILTLLAFSAAAIAIYQQHEAGIKQEADNKKLLDQQKKDGIKQEIIGAWQVIANKALGNSGKIEAIEFLTKQGKTQAIDMSAETNGGQVYLQGLNVSKETTAKTVDFRDANFSGANLRYAHFSDAYLNGANFSGADLRYADFSGANLHGANFSGADFGFVDLSNFRYVSGLTLTKTKFEKSRNFDKDIFRVNFITSDNPEDLPTTPKYSEFKFDFVRVGRAIKTIVTIDFIKYEFDFVKNGDTIETTEPILYKIHLVKKE